jgi:hypothetical protein
MSTVRSILSEMSLGLESPLAQLVEAKYVSAKLSQSLIFASSEVTTIYTKSGLPVRKCLIIILWLTVHRHDKLRKSPVSTSLLPLLVQKAHTPKGRS